MPSALAAVNSCEESEHHRNGRDEQEEEVKRTI